MKFTTCIRTTGKLLAKSWILGCDSNGTGVLVANTHHEAPKGHERCSGKTKLLRPKQAGNRYVATVLS